MLKFSWYYGLDPQKPYVVSARINNTMPIAPEQYGPADIDPIIAGTDVTPAFTSAEKFAKIIASILQKDIHDDSVAYFRCTVAVNIVPEDPTTETTVMEYNALDYNFGTGTHLQTEMFNVVAGLRGKVIGGAFRPFAVGLVNQVTMDLLRNQTLQPDLTGYSPSTSQPLRGLAYIKKMFEHGEFVAPSRSAASGFIYQNVNFANGIYKGYRRG